jgi:tRNA-Thr(GGU) m(6)t(6)A37 methyltransferase TsaA
MEKQLYSIKPVGFVHIKDHAFNLEILPEFRPAVKELDGFSHIQVMFWFHFADYEAARSILVSEKPYKHAPEELGVFATRSPVRPNPIALTVAQIISVDMENGIINIAYTDADDNTPVIDIKPYHPATDRVKDVIVPDWCSHWPKWYEDNATFDWQNEFVNTR